MTTQLELTSLKLEWVDRMASRVLETMRGREFSADDLHAVLEVVEARIDLGVELGDRHDHLESALEAFGQCFGNLHGTI